MRYLCMVLSILLLSASFCKASHLKGPGLSYAFLIGRLSEDVPKERLSQWHENTRTLADKALLLGPSDSWRPLLKETLALAEVEGVIVEAPHTLKNSMHSRGESVPVARLIEGRIGYLYLPDMTSPTFPAAEFFQSLRALCLRYAGRKLLGWVLDLRDTGAYDAPGLWWALRVLFPAQGDAQAVTKQERRLQHTKNIPLAILISEKTRYAAEQVAISLLTRPLAKSFGRATLGERVFFEPVVLSHHLRVYLKRLPIQGPKEVPLIPQVPTQDEEGDQDHTLNAALKWIVGFEAPQESTSDSESVQDKEPS
ncbi:MAG: S41 family peptidase [Alphaproteobacteria bacterium]|jgi:hypothetical protein